MVFNCPECGKPAYQAPSNSTLVAGNVVVRRKRCRSDHNFLTVEAVIDSNATLTWDDIVVMAGLKGETNGQLRPDRSILEGSPDNQTSPQIRHKVGSLMGE